MPPRHQPTADVATLPAELIEKSDDDIEGVFNPIFDESGDEGEGKRINFDSIFDPIYDEYVGEEEDQIINFSPTFDESDGEEEEEDQFSFNLIFEEIEQEDECPIFDEGNE
ncbi:hypothetical protein TIFTF001_015408 [Ficus carica]|uniref:Uncharacterized protein n=1 Tax=Ficus carica TaxID=3494 RepID=A0AA88D8X9_FICCA|nr:hypothetical protein TIFTF001_015408 [Ficus carica]